MLDNCPYDLVAPIGSGGCAQVFRGVRRDTGLVAAVKVQREGVLGGHRFRREIDVLSQLDHPHVMGVIEADRHARWYAMPLAEGTLDDLRTRDPFAWSELRHALSSICGALLHTHPRGLVHRDVSSTNVLEMPGGHWVLSDYGLVNRPAGRPDTPTRTGAGFGTPRFSAPEVHHDPRTATPASDAYSIGALASWFTGIAADQDPTSEIGQYWWSLVRGTVLFRPEERWAMDSVASHLSTTPATVEVPAGFTPPMSCPRCGRREGVDGTGRCVSCGFVDDY